MRINQSFFGVYHGLSQHFVRPSVDGPVHGLSSFSIEMARYPSSFRQLWVDGTLLGVYPSTLGHFWENDFQWYTPSSNTSMFFSPASCHVGLPPAIEKEPRRNPRSGGENIQT